MYPFAKEEEAATYLGVADVLPRLRYEGPHKKSVAVAEHYGFHALAPLKVESVGADERAIAERIAALRMYLERGLDACTQPARFAHTLKPARTGEPRRLRLEVVGVADSIAETILFQVARAILLEHGVSAYSVALNSHGERDTFAEFARAFAAHGATRHERVCDECRQSLASDPLALLSCARDECRAVAEEAPTAIEYLSEDSRKHFYEVIESLESLGIPYTIDHALVGEPDAVSRTIFEIRSADGATLARGERFDHLAKRAGLGRHLPAVGVSFSFVPRGARARERTTRYKIQKSAPPLVYLVHIGPFARHRALLALERLRLAKLSVASAFIEHNLHRHLELADNLETPVLVIIGHKEACEDTAIVRDRESGWQTTVPSDALARELARMLKKYPRAARR